MSVCMQEQWYSLRVYSAFVTSWCVIFNQRLIDCKGGWGQRGSTLVFLHTVQFLSCTPLNVLKPWVKVCPLKIKLNRFWLCYKLCVRNLCIQPLNPDNSLNVSYHPSISLLNRLWAAAYCFLFAKSCLPVARQINSRVFAFTKNLTPQHAGSCTRGIDGWWWWGEGLDTTAACWNNRAAERTAPQGSYYPPELLIGYLDCREKRLACSSTVARSHIIDESILKGMLTEEYIALVCSL